MPRGCGGDLAAKLGRLHGDVFSELFSLDRIEKEKIVVKVNMIILLVMLQDLVISNGPSFSISVEDCLKH